MQSVHINAAGQQVIYDYGDRYSDPTRTNMRRTGDSTSANKGRYQMAQMYEKHHEIARMILLGMSNKDIAEVMSCSAQLVSNVRNSPVVKEKLALMVAVRDKEAIDLSREIADLAPIALMRVKEAITTGKVFDKEVPITTLLKEANGVLDREMGKPTQTINTKNLHAHFTLDDINEIKQKAKSLAMLNEQMA
jgi:DNA-binding CsgD family transcriptional regulator